MLTWLSVVLSEVAFGFGAWYTHRHHKQRQLLFYGINQPTQIPVLDHHLEMMRGELTKREQFFSKHIIVNVRRFVKTQAFEYLVQAWCNPRSGLHTKINKLDKYRKKLGLGL